MHSSPVVPFVMLASIFASPGGCTGPEEAAEVRIALRASTSRTDDPARYVFGGTRLAAVVREEEGLTVTLASLAAAQARETFLAELESGARPAIGEEVRLRLPVPDDRLANRPVEIVLFEDGNGNDRWDRGEAWVSAWNGSHGSYYLIYLSEPRADLPGSHESWNLCEGGEPADCAGPLDRAVVYVTAINEPILN
jgi:hypothetical protein